MTPEPFVVKENDTLVYVLEKMFEKKIQRIPVVDDKNELIGFVLRNEILKIVLKFIKNNL